MDVGINENNINLKMILKIQNIILYCIILYHTTHYYYVPNIESIEFIILGKFL